MLNDSKAHLCTSSLVLICYNECYKVPKKGIMTPKKSPNGPKKGVMTPPKVVPRPQTCPERFLGLNLIGWKASIASSSSG